MGDVMAYIIGHSGYTKEQFLQSLNGKQDLLVATDNIKTINGNNILGAGNVDISPQHYEYDLTETELALKTDTLSKIQTYNPNGNYVMVGFITDLHTMPTREEILADNDIESVVEAIQSYGIELEPVGEGETIAGQIKATYPSSDPNYYGQTSLRSIILLGSICHDTGVDAVIVNGDLSSGRLPYNSYAYMLEVVTRQIDAYISVPYFFTDGNHDRRYNSNVNARINTEWRKYQSRMNRFKNLSVAYVKDIQEALAYDDAFPLLGYFVDIDKNANNKLRLAVMSSYEKQNGDVPNASVDYSYATCRQYTMSMTTRNPSSWMLCAIAHNVVPTANGYLSCALNGTAHGKGASSDQHQFPAMNGGNKYKGVVGGIYGHLHQSTHSVESGYHTIRVINSFANIGANTNNYGFSIFIFDTDNWWMYEIQVGRHYRNDEDYPQIAGIYEKINDGVYRYKINHNE